MKEKMIIICTIIIIVFIISLLLYFFSKYKKIRRVLNFSLEERNGTTFLDSLLFDFSDFLESLVIFNGVSRTYDKFIFEDSKLRKGIDYIAIKIILGILFTIIFYITSYFYLSKIYFSIQIASFCLGFILVDFYCINKYINKNKINRSQYIKMIIIMNNGFKSHKSIDKILVDCLNNTDISLNKQLNYVLNDYRIGIPLQKCFERMYYRTKDEYVLFISNYLKLNNEGVDLDILFQNIEKELLNKEKLNKKIESVKKYSLLISLVFIFLPLIFIISVMFSKEVFINGIISDYGFAILLIEMIIYLLYLIFTKMILKGRY